MTDFTIRFRGVRGSMATPGLRTAHVGGNTSCVEVLTEQGRIVLDAGTGLSSVGDDLIRQGPQETHILLSHLHWDHIQGLPFFKPIYAPGHAVHLYSGPNTVMPLDAAMRHQMRAPFFPVAWDELQASVTAEDVRPGRTFDMAGATVRAARLNHPDPVYAYRIDSKGGSVVYATDTEHFSVVDPNLCALARGADILIYDAQYTPDEYVSKVGWGHSTYAAGCELAKAAGVGRLVLFHHDPTRSDDDVREIEQRAQELFPSTVAAREGLTLCGDRIDWPNAA